MSPGVGQLWRGMSDSVWVKIVGGGRCRADICRTLDSELLFNLVAAGQSGRAIGISACLPPKLPHLAEVEDLHPQDCLHRSH